MGKKISTNIQAMVLTGLRLSNTMTTIVPRMMAHSMMSKAIVAICCMRRSQFPIIALFVDPQAKVDKK